MLYEPVPKNLFKYAPPALERIHEVILGGQVYFPSPLDFNDPFDCRVALDVSTPDKAKKWAQVADNPAEVEKLLVADPAYAAKRGKQVAESALKNSNVGVCCLAKKPDCPLMWAHYAGSHEGVCFEFDLAGHVLGESGLMKGEGRLCFPFVRPMRVRYEERPPVLPDTEQDEFWRASFGFKSEDWKHEHEWRAVMLDSRVATPKTGEMLPAGPILSRCFGSGHGYPMDDGLLSGVILGCRIRPGLEKAVVAMAKARGLAIRKINPANLGYDLEIIPYGK